MGSIAAGHTTYTLFTTSHVRTHTRYYTIKSHTLYLNLQWSHRFIWWNHYHQVPSYTGKNITSLFPLVLLLVLHTCNNTDGNKLVIFSGIAWYCILWWFLYGMCVYTSKHFIWLLSNISTCLQPRELLYPFFLCCLGNSPNVLGKYFTQYSYVYHIHRYSKSNFPPIFNKIPGMDNILKGHKVTTSHTYGVTSLIRTPLVPNQLSWLVLISGRE